MRAGAGDAGGLVHDDAHAVDGVAMAKAAPPERAAACGALMAGLLSAEEHQLGRTKVFMRAMQPALDGKRTVDRTR